MNTQNSYQHFLHAAENAGLTVRETTQGKQASIQTPGHSPRDLGTSVTYNGDRTLVYCHNGDIDDVLAELGLNHRDLFDHPRGSEYRYDDGRVVFRTVDKKFRQDGNKQGTALFGLSSLVAPGPVYITEGENDQLTAQNVCGVAAVSQAGGASQDPARADWSQLQGRDVVIVRDNDEPGHKRAGKVYAYLTGMERGPASIQIVDVAAGKDLSDHIATGHSLDELNPVSIEGPPRRAITLLTASSVATERLDWLIDNWIPTRSLTLLAGREGLGKSTIACDIAAQATRGELDGKPMNVAYLNTEDSRSITVKPRLQAAGADLDRVFFIDVTTEEGGQGSLNLPGDTGLLSAALVEHNVKLVILDAAKSAMNSRLDGYRDDDVRQFLEPLAAMCDRRDMSILGLVHFGKRESSDPGKLILGSVAWSQIARSVLSVAQDDDGGLVVTNTKGNLAPAQISREARIESAVIPTDDGKTADVGRIVWGEETNVSAADLLVSQDNDEKDERNEIEAVVLDYLESHGGSAPAGDVLKATRAAGLSDNVVKKSRKKIGIKTERQGFGPGAQWVWTIDRGPNISPIDAPIDSIDSHARTRESMAPMKESMPAHRPSLTLLPSPDLPTNGQPATPRDTQSRREVSANFDTVLDVLSPEHFMSPRTIKGSFTGKQLEEIGDLDAALLTLLDDGLVETDAGKYRKTIRPSIA